jgi:hypothetical protein
VAGELAVLQLLPSDLLQVNGLSIKQMNKN